MSEKREVTAAEKQVLKELIENAEMIIKACYQQQEEPALEENERGASVPFFVYFMSGKSSVCFKRWYPCEYTPAVRRLRDDIEEAFEGGYMTFEDEHGSRIFLNMATVERIEL